MAKAKARGKRAFGTETVSRLALQRTQSTISGTLQRNPESSEQEMTGLDVSIQGVRGKRAGKTLAHAVRRIQGCPKTSAHHDVTGCPRKCYRKHGEASSTLSKNTQ